MTDESLAAPKPQQPTAALNGRACCLLDLPCCIPPPGSTAAQMQETILAHLIQEALSGAGYEGLALSDCASAGRAILQHVDLVPRGVGAAIVKGYARFMSPKPPGAKA